MHCRAEGRLGLVPFDGKDVTTIGPDIRTGQTAPSFMAVDREWQERDALAETRGKVRVLAGVPSLDKSVGDIETRRFYQEAAGLGGNVRIFVLSNDLPFAQKRWCRGAGVDRVTTLSDTVCVDFGTRYGCLIQEKRLLRRAVFVIGRDDSVVYADCMPALGEGPKSDEVLAAVCRAL
jgi:thiol peroxidase